VCPSTGGVLDGITVGGGVGLGMGGLGGVGGRGDLDTGGGGSIRDTGGGVLPGIVSVHCSSVDLGSGSGALGHGNGRRCSFLCAPDGVWFSCVGLVPRV
jgi:hypothetical protein